MVKKKPANPKVKPMPKGSAGRLGVAKVHLKSRAQRGIPGQVDTALRMLSAKQKEKKKRGYLMRAVNNATISEIIKEPATPPPLRTTPVPGFGSGKPMKVPKIKGSVGSEPPFVVADATSRSCSTTFANATQGTIAGNMVRSDSPNGQGRQEEQRKRRPQSRPRSGVIPSRGGCLPSSVDASLADLEKVAFWACLC